MSTEVRKPPRCMQLKKQKHIEAWPERSAARGRPLVASYLGGRHRSYALAGTGEESLLQRGLYGSLCDWGNIMRLMKIKEFPLAVFALVIAAAPAAMASTCSVNDKLPATARIFAKTSAQGAWREYPSLAEAPQLALNGGMTAELVQQKKNSPSVTVIAPGEDFWSYTRYCYRDDGQLADVSFEIRTEMGWGYRMEGTAFLGGFSANTHEFFRTKDGKPIARPEGVGEAPLGLQPTLYLTVRELPFAPLLKTAVKSAHGNGSAPVTLASADN
jgi:hypothetical protein